MARFSVCCGGVRISYVLDSSSNDIRAYSFVCRIKHRIHAISIRAVSVFISKLYGGSIMCSNSHSVGIVRAWRTYIMLAHTIER